MYTHTHVHTRMHTHMHAHTHTCTHTRTHNTHITTYDAIPWLSLYVITYKLTIGFQPSTLTRQGRWTKSSRDSTWTCVRVCRVQERRKTHVKIMVSKHSYKCHITMSPPPLHTHKHAHYHKHTHACILPQTHTCTWTWTHKVLKVSTHQQYCCTHIHMLSFSWSYMFLFTSAVLHNHVLPHACMLVCMLSVIWYHWKGWYYSLRVAEMRIRPGGV